MIRCIVAIDSKYGIANEHGIPWQGKLPTEVSYYRSKISGKVILMGSGTYNEFKKAPTDTKNYVLTRSEEPLREGFNKVSDLTQFFKSNDDVWVIGGAGVFTEVLDSADELYVTRIDQDFNCTKFFPKFEDKFELIKKDSPIQENGITFHYEVWSRK